MARKSAKVIAEQLAEKHGIAVRMDSDDVIDIRTPLQGYRLASTGSHSTVIPFDEDTTDAQAWKASLVYIEDGVEPCPADCECWNEDSQNQSEDMLELARRKAIERLRSQVDQAVAYQTLVEIQKLHSDGGASQGYTENGYGYYEHTCETCGTFGEYGVAWPCETRKLVDQLLGEENHG